MSYFRSLQQNVTTDTLNSSTTNLTGNQIFNSGLLAGTSTLGVAGIQVNLFTTQNCTIYVDQSQDNTNWDITDSYNYYYMNGGQSFTVQATAAYVRVRVKNLSVNPTTAFRLQTALCPIVEAVPRTLDSDGNFKVGVKSMSDFYGWSIENTPMGEMRVVQPTRLVGTNFGGSTRQTPDINFWSGSLYLNSQIYQINNQLILSCSATANSSASLQSVRFARYVGSYANRFRAQIQLSDTGSQDNIRSWGMYTPTDGVYFEFSGTNFNVVTRKTGVDTRVSSSNWNLSTVIPLVNTCNTYEIYVTNKTAYFSLNDVLVHKYSATSDTYSDTLTLPARLENKNFNGNTFTASLLCRVATISRLGPLQSQTQRGRVTAAGQNIFKFSAGRLDLVTCNTCPTGGGTVTIYDDINGNNASNIVALITAPNGSTSVSSMTPTTLHYGIPLANGLTVVSTGSWDVSVVYE